MFSIDQLTMTDDRDQLKLFVGADQWLSCKVNESEIDLSPDSAL